MVILGKKVQSKNRCFNRNTNILLEILDLTIAFKEGVCAGIIHNNDIKSFPVLRAPLDLAIKTMKTSGDVGLLKTLEILKLYWVLSYRLREASFSYKDILLDESTKKCYADFIKLYHGNNVL